MTVKKERLAERLAKLRNKGEDPKEFEKLSVQKLHHQIQMLEDEQEQEQGPEPEVEEVVPPQKEKKEKSLWSILVMDDTSSEDEE